MDYIEKAKQEQEKTIKYAKVLDLLSDCTDIDVLDYFNKNSLRMLDLKISVLKRINNGEDSKSIGKDYYKILENYPKE